MSVPSKQDLTEEIQPRYLKAGKVEKIKILDEYTAATGYHRKYVIKILKHDLKRKGYKIDIFGGDCTIINFSVMNN